METRCPEHAREARREWDARAPRANWRQRGYDREYDRNRLLVLAEETVCGLCGKPVDTSLPGTDPLGPCVDHITPRSRGGTNDRSNLRLAHTGCNASRQDGDGEPSAPTPPAEPRPEYRSGSAGLR